LSERKPVLYKIIYEEFQFDLETEDDWHWFVEGIACGLN